MGRTSDARERLLQSASELIHDKGFHAVGISEICARAGVQKGSFYHFFPSKQLLALELVDRYRRTGSSLLEEALSGDRPPLERLANYFDTLQRRHQQACPTGGGFMGCPLGNLASEMSTHDQVLRQRLLVAFDEQIGHFEALLEEAEQRGELAPGLTARQGAEALVALIEGQIMLAKLHDDPGILANLAQAGLRLVTDTTTAD